MPRPAFEPQRDLLDVDWPFFGELCRALALRVAQGYDPDIVLGIAKAGVIPAAIIATILRRDLATMTIARPDALEEPTLVVGPPPSIRGLRVLLVDETCDSGATMKLALAAVRALQPADVRSAVSFRTGPWTPDYYAFETQKAIVLPWDREVVVDGELRLRPELEERLRDD